MHKKPVEGHEEQARACEEEAQVRQIGSGAAPSAAPSGQGARELNTTAHELIVEIGSEMGAYNAAESGEDIRQCTALEVNRVRQRLAVQIWRYRSGAVIKKMSTHGSGTQTQTQTHGPG